MNPLDHIMSVEQAAQRWKLHPSYVKNLCAQGKIRAVKLGKTWIIDKSQTHPSKPDDTLGRMERAVQLLKEAQERGIAPDMQKIHVLLNVPYDEEPVTDEEIRWLEQIHKEMQAGKFVGLQELNIEIEIQLDGCVTTCRSTDEWTDDFLKWLESRGETFGGGINEYSDD